MGQTFFNSAFKVKVGTIPVIDGIVPEKGALLFDESISTLYLGDGFNWTAIELSTEGMAVTGESFIDAMTAGVLLEPADYFDTIVYNRGTALTISIPAQTVTVNTNGSYRIFYNYTAESTAPNTTLLFDIAINGTPTGSPVQLFMAKKDTPVSQSGTLTIPGIVATDVLTLCIEVDKTCTLTRGNQEVGISLIV